MKTAAQHTNTGQLHNYSEHYQCLIICYLSQYLKKDESLIKNDHDSTIVFWHLYKQENGGGFVCLVEAIMIE